MNQSQQTALPHPALPPEPKLMDSNRVLEVRMYWGSQLLRALHISGTGRVSLGEGKDADFFLSSEGLPAAVFPLVQFVSGACVLSFTDAMEGEVEVDGISRSLSELRRSSLAQRDKWVPGLYRAVLATGTRALIHWGGAAIAMQFVPPSRAVPKSLIAGADFHYLNSLVLSGVVHIMLLATLLLHPVDAMALTQPWSEKTIHLVRASFPAPKPEPTIPTPKPDPANDPKSAKAKPRSRPTAEAVPEKPRGLGARPADLPVRSSTLVERFTDMMQMGGAMKGGVEGVAISVGLVAAIGRSDSRGPSMGAAGARGDVASGGGLALSRPGSPVQWGSGLGFGPRYASGGLGRRPSKPGTVTAFLPPVIKDALPADVIRRVIEGNKQQVRACYERQLQLSHDLQGRIEFSWVIGATGRVVRVRVRNSTMNNSAVEGCVAARIKTWTFPRPAGGGVVRVNYPFVLHAG